MNDAPLLAPTGDKTVDEQSALSFNVSASDPLDTPADSIRYSAAGLPPGASFDPLTGAFSWTPGHTQAGTYQVTFTAEDDGAPAPSDAEIWLAPPPGKTSDLLLIDWATARQWIAGVKLYIDQVNTLPAATLQALAAVFEANQIQVAVECGGLLHFAGLDENVGVDSAAIELAKIRKFYDAGGQIDYLDMDGPLRRILWPTSPAPYNGLLHSEFTVDTAADQLMNYMATVKTTVAGWADGNDIRFQLLTNFPNWGYEGGPSYHNRTRQDGVGILHTGNSAPWGNDYGEYTEEIVTVLAKAAADPRGLAIDGVTIDNPFDYLIGAAATPARTPEWDPHTVDWLGRVRDYEEYTATEGLQFTLIANSQRGGGASDQRFYTDTLAMARAYQASGGHPTRYLVQSWYAYPLSIADPSDPYSMVSLARDVTTAVSLRDVETITITVGDVNAAPTVAAPASAAPNPVTDATAALWALGADVDTGEASLTYTWTTAGEPPAPVSFSANGTNAAKSASATFSKAGTYDFWVTISDGELSTASSVSVTVDQTLTSISVSPASASLYGAQTQQFNAVGNDQFGDDLASQPTFAWSTTAGSITSGGFYTAPVTDATATITAASGSTSGTGAVYVTGLPQIVRWESALNHGVLSDVTLAMADDNKFSEPRTGGVRRLIVTFDRAIAPESFTESSVLIAGNNMASAGLDLSSIVISVSLAGGNAQGIIDFSTSLPDRARYLVRLQGITDPAGNALYGDNDRVFTNLKGDSSGDLRTNVTDLSYIQSGSTSSINRLNVKHVRSDVNLDGRVNVTDLSASWAVRNVDARNISTPILAAGSPLAASIAYAPNLTVAAVSVAAASSGPVTAAAVSSPSGKLENSSTETVVKVALASGALNARAVDAAIGGLLAR